MAAFALSFNDLTRDNIRHIYSDRTPPIFVPPPRPFGKSSQFLDVPLVRRFPPRFYDYYPAFNVGLPRAPAFNQMTLTEIRQMLQRVERPIACQTLWQHHPQAAATATAEDRRSRRKIKKVVRFRSPVHDAFGLDPATHRRGQGHQGQPEEGSAQGGGGGDAGAKAEGQSEKKVSQVGAPLEKPNSKVTQDGSPGKGNLLPDLTETKKKPAVTSDGKVATSDEEVQRRVKDAAQVRGGDTASKPGAGEVGKRKKKWSSKREKVMTSFSRLSLLPPITKSHGQ